MDQPSQGHPATVAAATTTKHANFRNQCFLFPLREPANALNVCRSETRVNHTSLESGILFGEQVGVKKKRKRKKSIMSPVTTELPKKPINNVSVANFTVLRVVRLWRNKAVFSTHSPRRCCSATGSQIRPMALIIQPACRPFLAPPVDRGGRERRREEFAL